MDLDERKYRILQAIIDDYISTAMPVGSRTISRKQGMGLSSATIRNEMSDLEELGYLASPHTSAGRIPSYRAYRLYVDQIMRVSSLPSSEYSHLRSMFSQRMGEMEDIMASATQALSEMTEYTSVMIAPQMKTIKRVQLVPLTDTTALMVTVTEQGVHKDSVIRIPAGVTPAHLYAISNMLTEKIAGKDATELPYIMQEFYNEMHGHKELFYQLTDSLSRQLEPDTHSVHVAGAARMLSHPEYYDVERARSLLSTLETQDKLAKLLMQRTGVEFSVAIGPELSEAGMQDCSLVTVSYRVGGGVGTMGVIGPTRMHYGRVISVLEAMRNVMNEALIQPKGSDDKKEENHEG